MNFEKKKMIIFMIFAPPHYLSRVKRYSKLLLCEAPKGHRFKLKEVFFFSSVLATLQLAMSVGLLVAVSFF